MPYYDTPFTSASGETWPNGAYLYRGLGFYRSGKWYNHAEVYYRPHVADFLDIEVAFDIHAVGGLGLVGWQQRASLVFDLDALRHPAIRLIKERKTSGRAPQTPAIPL